MHFGLILRLWMCFRVFLNFIFVRKYRNATMYTVCASALWFITIKNYAWCADIRLQRRHTFFSHRREPLNEAHDSTFGILENYHCWRFHGSGVIAALQIILIFFCTGMHHGYFLRSSMCFRVPIYVRKYRKYTIDRWKVVCFRGDFAIKTMVGFLR